MVGLARLGRGEVMIDCPSQKSVTEVNLNSKLFKACIILLLNMSKYKKAGKIIGDRSSFFVFLVLEQEIVSKKLAFHHVGTQTRYWCIMY